MLPRLGYHVAIAWLMAIQAATGASETLQVDLAVHLEQQDREFGLEGYVADYRDRATITLRRMTLAREITDRLWRGFEKCYEPALEVDWQSEMYFDRFEFTEPDVGVILRGDEVWLLYNPARDFGVEHPGRPACDSTDGIAPGSKVAKSFYYGDLEEGAAPAGDHPVYLWEDREAFGGFVLTVVPRSHLRPGEPIPVDATFEVASEAMLMRLVVKGQMEVAD